jgi:hypothetical protein
VDANRLIRLTVAGWALILSWPLQMWVLGADLAWLGKLLTSLQTLPQATAIVLVGLAASPFLGLFVSSFAGFVIRKYRGGSAQFDVPSDADQLRRFLAALSRLLTSVQTRKELKEIEEAFRAKSSPTPMTDRQVKSHTDKFERYFNLLCHTQAPQTLIDYTTRRWTTYWMYANSICAILIATGLSLITAGPFWRRDQALTPAAIELLVILFVVFGLRELETMRQQILEMAWQWLYETAES